MPAPACEIIVDRIESAWAVVEWCGGDVIDLPAVFLPPGVVEGERLVVRVTRRSPGRHRFLISRNSSGSNQEKQDG